MKYDIDISIAEGVETGTGLGITWQIDTRDPAWRKELPIPQEMAALIEEHGAEAEPTLETAAKVLRRLGYDEIADVVERASEAEVHS